MAASVTEPRPKNDVLPPPILEPLSDDVALQCLARVPAYYFPQLMRVNSAWRTALKSSARSGIRQSLGFLDNCILTFSANPNPTQLDTTTSSTIRQQESLQERTNLGDTGKGSSVSDSKQKELGVGFSGHVNKDRPLCCKEFGGVGSHKKLLTCLAFDPFTRVWFDFPLPLEIAAHQIDCAAIVYSGQLWIVGGEDDKGVLSRAAWVYDLHYRSWTRKPDLTVARSRPFGVGFRGHVYILGLSTRERISPDGDWELIEDVDWPVLRSIVHAPGIIVGQSLFLPVRYLLVYGQSPGNDRGAHLKLLPAREAAAESAPSGLLLATASSGQVVKVGGVMYNVECGGYYCSMRYFEESSRQWINMQVRGGGGDAIMALKNDNPHLVTIGGVIFMVSASSVVVEIRVHEDNEDNECRYATWRILHKGLEGSNPRVYVGVGRQGTSDVME